MLRQTGLSLLCVMFTLVFAASSVVTLPLEAAVRTKSLAKKASSKKKKKRSSRSSKCSPAARAVGKKQAIDLVSSQSPELCRLTGMEYKAGSEDLADISAIMAADGEILGEASNVRELQYQQGEDLAELEREDDVTVDIDAFTSLWLSYVDQEGGTMTEGGIPKQKVIDVVMDWLGTRYQYGGMTRGGIDCSAFTRMIFETTSKVTLPRSAAQQSTVGKTVSKRSELQFGDLVFFNTRRRVAVGHVGIYLGDDLFAHSSSRYGVTISSLKSTYYGKRLIGARRLTEADMAQLSGDTARH